MKSSKAAAAWAAPSGRDDSRATAVSQQVVVQGSCHRCISAVFSKTFEQRSPTACVRLAHTHTHAEYTHTHTHTENRETTRECCACANAGVVVCQKLISLPVRLPASSERPQQTTASAAIEWTGGTHTHTATRICDHNNQRQPAPRKGVARAAHKQTTFS